MTLTGGLQRVACNASGLRRLIVGLLAIAVGLAIAPGSGVAQSTNPSLGADQGVVSYDIPRQDLNTALLLFADRAGLQLVYDPALVEGRRSAALSGAFRAQEGLTRLLAGTGITFRPSGADTVTLERAATQNDSGPLQLGPIVVQGDKVGRTTAEIPPSTEVIDGAEADQPSTPSVISAIRGIPNVFAEEGIQLPAIRGIDGTAGLRQAFSAGTQPRVPVLIDGVARPLSNSFSISRSSTWDVSSIEVARGPQPSSTGRNALAGAVRVFTNDPIFEFEGAARLSGQTADGTVGGAAMVNVPILPGQLAFRGTVEEERGKSYVDVTDPTDFGFDVEDEEFRRYRGKLLIVPEVLPELELQFGIDYIHTEGPLPGFVDGDPSDLEVADFATNSAYENNDQTAYLGTAGYELSDFVDVNLRTSFIDNDLAFPGSGFTIEQREFESESFVQFDSAWIIDRGVVGVIHNRATEDTDASTFSADGDIHNTGIYGEAEVGLGALGLLDDLTLIAGGRYEIDDRSRSVIVNGASASDRSFTEQGFMPKVGLRYQPTPDVTVGYTYSESFRPGGIDVDLFAAILNFPTVNVSEFDPETLHQHEIYGRSSLWDGSVVLSASAFYYIYEDAQVPGASSAASVGGGTLFGNVPEARGLGLEFEADVQLTEQLSFTSGVGLLDTKITDPGPNLAQFQDDELPRAPNVTANFDLRYDSGFGFDAAAKLRYVSSTTSGLGQPKLGSYALLDLTAGYEIDMGFGSFRVDAFVENVTDKRYFTFRERRASGFAFDAVGRPRTFGIAGTLRF